MEKQIEETTTNHTKQKQKSSVPIYVLSASILIAAVLISGAMFYTDSPSSGGDVLGAELEVKKTDNVIGDKDAPVTIIEYSDFQCPFCRTFYENAYQSIKSEYIDKGIVRLVYRHMPLNFHAAAVPSAHAVECAAEQDKFWELHDAIFENQTLLGTGTVDYTQEDIRQWVLDIGVDASDFDKCMDSDKYVDKIKQDISDAARLGINGTPSFVINGRVIVGAQPFEAFRQVIEAELQ